MRLLILSAAALTLAGCATVSSAPVEEPTAEAPAGACDATPVQVHLGKRVSTDLGGQILAQSGARTLRWGPPDSAWTMDYREDRVNVRYDRDMVITAITCG